MNLITGMEHKKGGKVTVNGTRYDIDIDGIITNVAKKDAAKLLKGNSWREHTGKLPKKVKVDPDPETDEDTDDETDLEDLDIEELRALADEYEISYTVNTGKPRLIREITEAMEAEE